jgi:hypothetical protein
MNNYRIIETDSEYPDVLIYRTRDDNGKEIVVVYAIGIVDDSEDNIAEETINFGSFESAKSYVNDYTKKSAHLWCEKENIVYGS